MPDIEIKRGYEVLPDNSVRFGIRVINNSNSAISDVEVLIDYTESLFELSGNKIQKLGTIPSAVPRTAKFILKPLGCIHKENIGATIIYKDHQWKKHTIEMNPKEVHCVCPFLKEKPIKRADFLTLSKSGFFEERGVNFEGITVEKLVEFISHTCKNRLYRVDEFPIENGKIIYLASESIGEKAYYLLTALIKEEDDLTQVMLRAVSDKPYGLNGFLNETVADMRHVVETVQSAREIGVIKKEQVINIIDSVVQRTTFAGGEDGASVNIKDSVVTRTEFKGDEERKKRDEERLRKEEEQERLHRQEKERRHMEEEQRWEKQEKYEAFLLKQKTEEEWARKAKEDRERKNLEATYGKLQLEQDNQRIRIIDKLAVIPEKKKELANKQRTGGKLNEEEKKEVAKILTLRDFSHSLTLDTLATESAKISQEIDTKKRIEGHVAINAELSNMKNSLLNELLKLKIENEKIKREKNEKKGKRSLFKR